MAAPGPSLADEDLADLGRMLVALGDPTRQQVVLALSRERLNVGQLAERFPLSRAAISHHLKVLAHAGLLVRERLGRERVYRLDTGRCRGFAERVRRFVASCCANVKCCEPRGERP
jgi:DNA-binding transcriptional ArsR family regulator